MNFDNQSSVLYQEVSFIHNARAEYLLFLRPLFGIHGTATMNATLLRETPLYAFTNQYDTRFECIVRTSQTLPRMKRVDLGKEIICSVGITGTLVTAREVTFLEHNQRNPLVRKWFALKRDLRFISSDR